MGGVPLKKNQLTIKGDPPFTINFLYIGREPTSQKLQLQTFIDLLPTTYLLTLVCRIDVLARLLILRKNSPFHGFIQICMFIDFEKKKSPIHVYCILHVYWYLSCTFINFEKKLPPARPYFGLHGLMFFKNFSTYFARHTKVPASDIISFILTYQNI